MNRPPEDDNGMHRPVETHVERIVDRPFWRTPFFVIALVIVAGATYLALRPDGEEEEEEAEAVVAVQTTTVTIGTLDVTVDAIGTVEPRPGFVAILSAPEATRVQQILVSIGDRVRVGQPLVELDRAVWSSRRAEGETELATAQAALDRAQRLQAAGIVPRKDVEAAAAAVASARATLQEAQRLETLGTLRSPIEGIVVELNASLSQPVDPSQPVVEIIDPRGLEVLFHVPAADAARIAIGAAVTFSRGTERDSIPIGRGTVLGISAEVAPETGSVAVRTRMTQPAQIRAGELIAGRIVAEHLESVVTVPAGALVPEEDGFLVYVVDEENVAHATPVEVGARGAAGVQILEGLTVGQVVVTEGAYGVSDGAKVERDAEKPAGAAPEEPATTTPAPDPAQPAAPPR